MFKVLRIKFSWNIWCVLTDIGYRLAGVKFATIRRGRSWHPLHGLARLSWRTADKVFAVDDKDFMLAYPYDEEEV